MLLGPQRFSLLQQGIKMFTTAKYEGFNAVGDKAGISVEQTSLGIVSEERGDSISMCCNKAAWGSAAGFSHLQFSFCDSCPQNSLFHTHSPYNIAIKGLRYSSVVLSMVRQFIQSHTQFITGYKKFCSLIKTPAQSRKQRNTKLLFWIYWWIANDRFECCSWGHFLKSWHSCLKEKNSHTHVNNGEELWLWLRADLRETVLELWHRTTLKHAHEHSVLQGTVLCAPKWMIRACLVCPIRQLCLSFYFVVWDRVSLYSS